MTNKPSLRKLVTLAKTAETNFFSGRSNFEKGIYNKSKETLWTRINEEKENKKYNPMMNPYF